jgi:hypothetical protein
MAGNLDTTGRQSFMPVAFYHMEPCKHEGIDPLPILHKLNASLEELDLALNIADTLQDDEWAHTDKLYLYFDGMHFTLGEWVDAHKDWSRANVWLKEALARRQADGRIKGYEFLLQDPEMRAWLDGDMNTRIWR